MGLDNPLHILVIVLIVLLVFGARRIPEIGRSLGTGMREFKQSITGEEHHSQQAPAPTLAAGAPQPQAPQPVQAAVATPPSAAPEQAVAAAPAPAAAHAPQAAPAPAAEPAPAAATAAEGAPAEQPDGAPKP